MVVISQILQFGREENGVPGRIGGFYIRDSGSGPIARMAQDSYAQRSEKVTYRGTR